MAKRSLLRRGLALAVVTGLLAACAGVPVGPSRLALPGSGRNFEAFRLDDAQCRQQAAAGVSGARAAVNDAAAATAVASTAVGALAGAALGGHQGAGVGAGAGLLVGASAAGQQSAWAGADLQVRYDQLYHQCMYARGHRVPASGVFTVPAARSAPVPPPPPPPPPPGPPPPPPPGLR